MSMDMGGDELNEILEEFFTEADENLDTLEQDLIQLEAMAESEGTDKETVDRIFRMLHTLKGGAGFLGLDKIAKLAHAGENLLDEVRNERVAVDKPVMDVLLQTNDTLKQLLQIQKNRGDDAGVDTGPLREELELLASGKKKNAEQAKPFDLMASVLNDPTLDPARDKGEDGPVAKPFAKPVEEAPVASAAPALAAGVNPDLLAAVLNDPTLDPTRDKGEDGPVAKPVARPVEEAPVASSLSSSSTAVPVAPSVAKDPVLLREAPAVDQRQAETDRRQGTDDRRQGPRRGDDTGGETIRVETARLDKVMNLVGELVLARNTLLRQLNITETRTALEHLENHGMIYGTVEQLSRVTQDLQMSVLSTRMQPIKKVFDKIPRQVRELKTQLKKEVNLIIEGEMTEVDKSLVEELADPMVHMIRNALDHGIETPAERSAVGKHPEGTLVVRAFYEGNNVVIQVQDDGKGIDPAKIRKVGVAKGIISDAVANAMSDEEAVRLIMAPGFSTAEKVTDVSGRGVGMDVVNTKIANLQGSVDISSELGMGTCFSVYMPLTLAIVNALIVGANEEGFAIPIGDISEVIKFKSEEIHRVNDQHVIELRGEPLPLFYLSKLTHGGMILNYNETTAAEKKVIEEAAKIQPSESLSLDDLERVVVLSEHGVNAPEGAKKAKADRAFIVVVREGSSAMGLVVDELLGQEEVVIKPVSDAFEYNKAISGATITGDGKVHMILDVPYMLKDLASSTH